jgi:CheY-like chemotaxis protein
MSDTGKTILVVDDEKSLLCTIEAILRRGGYLPIAACGALEALETSQDFKGEIHLLLTDVNMPEIGGLTLAQHFIVARANIRVLLMSGNVRVSSGLPLLTKPFHSSQLLEQVSKVIASPPPVAADVFGAETSWDISAVHSALNQRLDAARRTYLDAARQFLAITEDVPSGIPGPDGVTRRELQAKYRRQAFGEYQHALKHLNRAVFSENDSGANQG